MNTPKYKTGNGFPLPFGITKKPEGINFSVFSKNAHKILLCLFENHSSVPFLEIPLDPSLNKTGDVWHLFIYDLPDDLHYSYRVDGPHEPHKGYYFDKNYLLLDPYAKLMGSSTQWGNIRYPELPKNCDIKHVEKAVIYPFDAPYEWENDLRPNIPMNEMIIYEMHVRGFTIDPSSKVENPGTFLGIIEKIPHLKALGINAIELMPIHEFNEGENIRENPITKEKLWNYWGYSTINFFSLMNRYSSDKDNAIREFKTLVKALHKNGIEIILDVVFNHTAEGNQDGPILSFRGLENSVYYILGPNGEFYNYSGCGNTLNCNIPVLRELIRDSLRYWVTEMHVDGFRFDLASILGRAKDGTPLPQPPLIEAITLDPVLANTKLIAEAWDAAGLYQVGSFPSWGVWAEWNGIFRDTIRKFIKGSENQTGYFATRLCGSEDLYGKDRSPSHSVNFITAHDGFSLRDLVSYNEKHNLENGENNQDGTNDNESWNCGVEGETDDKKILWLRQKQMKNFHLALMVSLGVPMLLMGDEYAHTKNGNNNTWCHDSRLNWFLWDELEKNQEYFRFYRMAIYFRKQNPILQRSKFLKERDIKWHGIEPELPDWSPSGKFLAFTISDHAEGYTLYIAFNSSYEALKINIPERSGVEPWYRIIDTARPSPEDIVENQLSRPLAKDCYTMKPYSSIVLKTFTPFQGVKEEKTGSKSFEQ